MTFFNRKEEVINIELTQFGKHKLSKGAFKPMYYAFFDDDIIYDYKFAGVDTEAQNDIIERIKETPRPKTQYAFSGIESEITKNIADIRRENQLNDRLELLMLQPTAEKHFTTATPIGSSQIGSEKAPAWKVQFLKGDIEGSVAIQTNSDQPSLRIPQIDVDVVYTTKAVQGNELEPRSQWWNDSETDSYDFGFEDNSSIIVKEDFVLFQIEELNSQELNGEFDLEVFKTEKEVVNGEITEREILIPLRFKPEISKNYKITSNNVYVPVDTSDIRPTAAERDDVEYFLDIDIDAQIDSQILCELKPADKTKGLYSKRFYECEDLAEDPSNPYEPDSPYDDPCED